MRRSIRAVVAATVALLGLGQSPANASSQPPPPGIGPSLCDGLTGTCVNTVFIRPVVFYADHFSPRTMNGAGGPALPHPQVWSVGHLKVAEAQDDLLGGQAEQAFALGILTVRPIGFGFISIPTIGVGRFVKSNNPLHPYRFEGVEASHDPDALRGQDFDFYGEQTGPIPPEHQSGP
jgi:hypothetical protein